MRERGDVVDPSDLMTLARAEPSQALVLGREALGELRPADNADRSRVLRAMSIASRTASTIAESIAHAESAVAEAVAAGERDLRSEAEMTLAGSLAIAGEKGKALQVIDSAARSSSGLMRAQLGFQRGAVLTSMGDFSAALDAYSATLPVFRHHRDEESEAQALKNRGLLLTKAGRLDEAESDLLAARAIHARLGAATELAGTDHNLGVLAAYRGDIPEALRRLTSSEDEHMARSGSLVPDHSTRAEILLSAGLFGEALILARRIAAGNRASGRREDEADALLVAAQAAQLGAQPHLARELAESAGKMFTEQSREAAAANAALVALEARYETEQASIELRDAALQVADRLRADHLLVAATNARLLSARLAIDLGDPVGARVNLEGVAGVTVGPVELRLQAHVADAFLHRLEGDALGAEAAATRGLALLDAYQVALGATDLRTGVERRAYELGAIGLDIALQTGEPLRVLGWMERTRARALLQRPVSPPADEGLRRDLSELRHVTSLLREQRDPELEQRQRLLQDSIARRSHVLSGVGSPTTLPLDRLLEALGDTTLVEFGYIAGELWRIAAREGRVEMSALGPVSAIRREVEYLRFAMKRAAHRNLGADALRKGVGRLDEMLLDGLTFPPDPVLIVPTPWLMAVPWSAMPSLSQRELTISPSAEMWWRAQMAERPAGGVVVAAGPDLEEAGPEISALAALYPEAEVLTETAATVDQVLSKIAGVTIAHIACHARFRLENPMFSSLNLDDGDLNVYDIERLEAPPGLMVLSACDSGFSESRPGEELMGLTSALLGIGTRTVIASIGLVPDSPATKDLMIGFHRRLLDGLGPAASLAGAQQDTAETPDGFLTAASFVCVGAA